MKEFSISCLSLSFVWPLLFSVCPNFFKSHSTLIENCFLLSGTFLLRAKTDESYDIFYSSPFLLPPHLPSTSIPSSPSSSFSFHPIRCFLLDIAEWIINGHLILPGTWNCDSKTSRQSLCVHESKAVNSGTVGPLFLETHASVKSSRLST